MPYKDPWKGKMARKMQYWRKKQEGCGCAPMWWPVDMLLAAWCVQLRHRIAGLEAMWRVVVPVITYPILRGTGKVGDREVCVMGTRIVLRAGGMDRQVCEFEGEDIVADLLREQKEFDWALSRAAVAASGAAR